MDRNHLVTCTCKRSGKVYRWPSSGKSTRSNPPETNSSDRMYPASQQKRSLNALIIVMYFLSYVSFAFCAVL